MRSLAAGCCTLALALAALPAPARADLFSSVSYGAHVSSVGDGITLEKPLLYDFSVRVVTNSMSVSQQLAYDGNPYTSTARFRNVGLIGDFRPYGGRYRISGGLLFGGDRIDNVARDDGASLRVGSGTYPTGGTGTVSTRVAFTRPALYAGVGGGTGLVRGLALDFDAGLLVRNGVASAAATGPLRADPVFAADLSRLRGELRTRVISPVISVGLVYRP